MIQEECSQAAQHKPILPSQMNSTAEVCHQHGTTPSLTQHNTKCNPQHTHRLVTAYTAVTHNLIHSAITIHCLCSIITSLHGCAHRPPSHTHKQNQTGQLWPLPATAANCTTAASLDGLYQASEPPEYCQSSFALAFQQLYLECLFFPD